MDATVWQGRAAFAITMLAVVYSLALLLWPIDSPVSLLLASQALVMSLVMWAVLHRRCTAGGRAATWAAFGLATLFVGYSLVGMSFAAGAFPAALALMIATALTPTPQ